jgi:hypothetical protein
MRFMRSKRSRLLAVASVLALSSATIAALLLGSGAKAGTSPSDTAIARVTWLCQSASSQIQAGTASSFMYWINQRCNTEGATSMAANASVPANSSDASANSNNPIGVLICEYANQQVQQGAATQFDQTQAHLCSIPPTPSQTGIVPLNQLPDGTGVTPTSEWAGTVNGDNEQIFGGAQAEALPDGQPGNPEQGLVLVVNLSTGRFVSYPSSQIDGPLTIETANGDTLALTASDGATYTFDVTTNVLTRVG